MKLTLASALTNVKREKKAPVGASKWVTPLEENTEQP